MLCCYLNRTYTGLRLRNGHLDNAKIKVQSAKLWNPGLVGMGVLVVASFSISRILYLLDIYYTPSEVGRQGKSPITTDTVLYEAWGLSPTEGSKDRKSQNHPPTKASFLTTPVNPTTSGRAMFIHTFTLPAPSCHAEHREASGLGTGFIPLNQRPFVTFPGLSR